jgi:hypothetical protein
MSDGGKGDKRRPGDNESFDKGYSAIFGEKKPVRGKFIWSSEQKRMVPEGEFYESAQPAGPYVVGDIQPYRSMQTGEMITSRSHHRAHLKQHGLVEIGNEIKAAMTKQKPKDDREGRRRAIADVLNAKGY